MPGERRRPKGQSRKPPKKRRSDLGARIIVAIPAIVIALLVMNQGGLIFSLSLIILGILGMHELYGIFERFKPVRIAGFLALIALIFGAQYGGGFDVLLFAAFSVPIVFLLSITRPVRSGVSLSIAVTLLGIFWIGVALAHAVLLRDLPHGYEILIDVLIGTFLADTGAYLGGRMFGSRPLAPHISPNKTVEGLISGILVGALAVWFAGLYQDWLGGTDALLLGLAVAVTGPLGDLFESLLKRDANVKDSGRAFGVHGGVLDRLDAAFFTVVVGYYVWTAML